MAYCKRLLIIFLILFILLFNFGFCFAEEIEEQVTPDKVTGLSVEPNQNFFKVTSNQSVGYFYLESGYKYIITNTGETYGRNLAVCNDIPEANGVYQFLTQLPAGESFEYISNGSYLVFAFSNFPNTTITRVKLASQDSAINDLVANVGPNALWGVFGSGIDFVFVVVLVAFGIFIIVKVIKGISKGKSKI